MDNRKGILIKHELNPLLDQLAAKRGLHKKELLKRLGIPARSNKCTTKQITGYISRIRRELIRYAA